MKFKLIFATLFLVTMIASRSYAQKSMEWGLKAGGNCFRVGGRSFDSAYRLSFSGGVYAEINYTKHFSIQPELLFNQVLCKTSGGFNQIYSNYGGISYQLVSVDYISVPILLVYKPVPLLSILLGPQYSYAIAQTKNLLQVYPNMNAFNHSDFSLVFGGQLNMGKVKVGLRWQEGLVNINNINSTDAWRTYGAQLYFAVQIGDWKVQ